VPDERWRLFVAAALAAATAAELYTALAPLRERHPGARWLPPEQYHDTLVFLGQTEAAELPRIVAAVERAAAGRPAFTARLRGAGGRDNGWRGGVAWVTTVDGRAELAELARAVDDELQANAYRERRPLPHITVARRADRALLEDLRRLAARLDLEWPIERVVLFRSRTGPAGSRYEELAAAPLAGA
jgi:2'-5' RNA ligase